MFLLLASVVCSVAVTILLKLATPWRLDMEEAINVNYVMATALSLLLLKPSTSTLFAASTPWLLLVILGVLLPGVFLLMAAAVRHAGIVLSDASQRLSLLLPLTASFLLFGESTSTSKLFGILVAVTALLCLLAPHPQANPWNGSEKTDPSPPNKAIKTALLLLGVWLGYGLIDISFKQLARIHLDFSSSLLAAFIFAGLFLGLYRLILRRRWSLRSTLAGLVLGCLNFGNIYFYIRAHQAWPDNPTLVFTSINIGVIGLGTLAGAGLFREKLTLLNIVGLLLAIGAIVLLII